MSSGQFDVTDTLGRTTSYLQGSAGPGKPILSIKKPGSSAPDIIYYLRNDISYGSFVVVDTVTKDSVTWEYEYILEPGMFDYYWLTPAPRYATMTVTAPDSGETVVDSLMINSKPRTITDPLGRITAIQYGSVNDWDVPSKVTATDGSYVEYEYASGGRIPTKETYVAKPGSGLANIVITRGLANTCLSGTSCQNIMWEKDGRGNQTDYTYNSDGQIATVTAPAPTSGAVRPQKRYSYTALQAYYKNSLGSIVASGTSVRLLTGVSECVSASSCAGTAGEAKATTSYGPQTAGTANNLLPLVVTNASGDGALSAVTTASYDDIGNRILVDGPLSGSSDTVKTRYDAARQVIGIVQPDPDGAGALKHPATRITYTPKGQVSFQEAGTVDSQSDPDWALFSVQSAVAKSYDVNGALIKEVRSAGGTTYAVQQNSYDSVGRLECMAQRMNPAIFSSLPTSACTLGTLASFGHDRITRNYYDLAGQVVQTKRAFGTALEQSHVTYSYTSTGKPQYVVDANGNKAELVYDGFSRPSKWIFPSTTRPSAFNPATAATALATAGAVNTGDYEAYGYDADGNRTSFRKRSGQTINYTIDALNRVTVKDIPGGSGSDVYYGYDLRGLQVSARFGSTSGAGVVNAYDALGHQTSSTSDVGGTARTLAYEYDLAGNRTRLSFPDSQYFTYDYDLLNRMTAIKENGVTTVSTIAYANDGTRSTLTGGGTSSYSFDGLRRLTSLAHDIGGTSDDVTFGLTSYNPASQLLSRTISNGIYGWSGAAALDRNYTTNGLNQYVSAGSATFSYDADGNLTSDGSVSYGYDVENRLTGASVDSATLAYDPLGRLAQVASTGTGTTRFLHDGDALVAEYDDTGTLLRRYVHGPNADEPLIWYEGGNLATRRHLRTDHQGSVVLVTTAADALHAINSYDTYGIPDAYNLGRFQYTGQVWLPEIGMYYYKARIYAPTLGRFLQTDPIGYQDQINLYAYVGNDPVNSLDPSGKYECRDEKACDEFEAARPSLEQSISKLEHSKSERDQSVAAVARAGLNDLGARGHKNGIYVNSSLNVSRAAWNPNQHSLDINTDAKKPLSAGQIGHELTHIVQQSAGMLSNENTLSNERQAYTNQAIIEHALGFSPFWDNYLNDVDRSRVGTMSKLSCRANVGQDKWAICQ